MKESKGKQLDLVRRAQQGDHDAFDELVDRYGTELFRLAVAVIGPDAAADVTQDALIRAWRELPKLRDPDRFLPWVRRIVVNRSRDVARSEHRRTWIPIEAVAPGETAVPGVEYGLTSRLDALTDLSTAIAALRVDQKSILALHYVLGLTIHESAVTLGVPDGTAKSRLNAALAALRQRLEVAP